MGACKKIFLLLGLVYILSVTKGYAEEYVPSQWTVLNERISEIEERIDVIHKKLKRYEDRIKHNPYTPDLHEKIKERTDIAKEYFEAFDSYLLAVVEIIEYEMKEFQDKVMITK